MQKIRKIVNRIVFVIIIIFIILLIIESNFDYKALVQNIINNNTNNSSIINTAKESVLQEEKPKEEVLFSDKINIENDKLNIIYFDVGQADSTLVVCEGKTLLIDAGNTYDGKKLVQGIKDLGIEKLDYVVGTHAHEDHLGGMSYIIDNFEIGSYYMPYISSNENSFYSRLMLSLSNKKISINKAQIGDVYSLGNSTIEVMSVRNDEPEDINESSIILELSYGNLKYLFMADAENINEQNKEWNDIDVLKVGHHGSGSGTSQNFLNQVLPEISIISVGENNDYELPNENVLKRLYEMGSDIYRTDIDGIIQIISDGIQNEIVKIDYSFDGG